MAIPPAPHLVARANVFNAFIFEPMERLTYALRKGRPMNDEDESLAREFIRRAHALEDALDARTPLVEAGE